MSIIDEEDKRIADERTAIVDQLEETIRRAVPKDRHLLEEPAILAELLQRFSHDQRDFQSCTFEAVIGGCIGLVMAREADNLAWLADTLHSQGYSEENQYDFGYADRYAFSLLNEEKRKVFALRTQNVNYLVLLTHGYRGWDIHLRQWWDAIPDATEKYLPYGLEPYIKGETMTLTQSVHMTKRLVDYADDIPGMDYPDRLSLKAFKDTRFAIGVDKGCAGLRYADARDRGYIATVKAAPFEVPEADGMTWRELARVHYVWYDLLSAIDTFRSELADDGAPDHAEG